MAASDSIHVPDKLLTQIVDDCYNTIEKIFTHAGKGRRPKFPADKVTNRLLLQLYVLKEKTGISWQKLEDILETVNIFSLYPKSKYRGLLLKVAKSTSSASLDLDQEIDLDWAGDYLNQLGIKKSHLENSSLLSQFQQTCSITNNLVIDLELFRRKFGKDVGDVAKWISLLGRREASNQKIKKTFDKYMTLKKTSSEKGVAALQSFLHGSFFPIEANTSSTDTQPDGNSSNSKSLQCKITSMASQQKVITAKLNASEEVIRSQQSYTSVVMDELSKKNKETTCLQTELYTAKEKIKTLQDEIERQASVIKSNKQTTREGWYMNLSRRERKIEQKEETLRDHTEGKCDETINTLRSELKKLQQMCQKLEAENGELRAAFQNDGVVIKTREPDSRKFTSAVRKCVLALGGDAEVPASRIGHVMQIVARELIGTNLDRTDVPSERTCLRFLDAGHVLSHIQLCTSILESGSVTLHSDGTSRDHRKYMGHQISTSNGEKLSVGFVPIAKETSAALLDVAVTVLSDLADAYSDNADLQDEIFKDVLASITSTMSDRAQNMKAFSGAFNERRKAVVGQQEEIDVLHCNAHFLLGLSSECDKALEEIEKTLHPLGRDRGQQFLMFGNKETAASRYIRTACDVLGPRGDEKNGCRNEWEAFCAQHGTKSLITSYRSNRFNNFFQSAAALHSQRHLILDFLSNCYTGSNKKVQSVLLDCQDDRIDSLMTALAIVYVRITGPFWMLLHSDTHYLDFYRYVVSLEQYLQVWNQEPQNIMDPQRESAFPGFELKQQEIMDGVFVFQDDQRPQIESALQHISNGCLNVLRRQLKAFLPGGHHHDIQDELRRQKLQHCSLTNLFGEQCFGDLDFSIFKRRNASIHHHSTINLLKRNKTSNWLATKSSTEQEQLLENSAKKAKLFRQRHQEMEAAVIQQQQNIMEANKAKKLEKEQKKQQEKQKVIQATRDHGGPCITEGDVSQLCQRLETRMSQKSALRSEILYQKLVLGSKSKLLRVTGTVEQLKTNLKMFLAGRDEQGMDVDTAPASPLYHSDDDLGSISSQEHTSSDEMAGFSDNETETPTRERKRKRTAAFSFQPEMQGKWVAVYYDDNFYLGQVMEVESNNKAQVSFVEACGLPSRSHCFRWPKKDDLFAIEAMYVFFHGFDMMPTNNSGRLWTTESLPLIKKAYKKFIEEYC